MTTIPLPRIITAVQEFSFREEGKGGFKVVPASWDLNLSISHGEAPPGGRFGVIWDFISRTRGKTRSHGGI